MCTMLPGKRCLGPHVMQLSTAKPRLLQVAIGVRSVSRGYIPDKAFIIVSLAVTAFMLIGWRTGLAALTKVCSVVLFNMNKYNLQSHPRVLNRAWVMLWLIWICSND